MPLHQPMPSPRGSHASCHHSLEVPALLWKTLHTLWKESPCWRLTAMTASLALTCTCRASLHRSLSKLCKNVWSMMSPYVNKLLWHQNKCAHWHNCTSNPHTLDMATSSMNKQKEQEWVHLFPQWWQDSSWKTLRRRHWWPQTDNHNSDSDMWMIPSLSGHVEEHSWMLSRNTSMTCARKSCSPGRWKRKTSYFPGCASLEEWRQLDHMVYHKKTHTDRYLHFQSHHHPQVKVGVISCLRGGQNRSTQRVYPKNLLR